MSSMDDSKTKEIENKLKKKLIKKLKGKVSSISSILRSDSSESNTS